MYYIIIVVFVVVVMVMMMMMMMMWVCSWRVQGQAVVCPCSEDCSLLHLRHIGHQAVLSLVGLEERLYTAVRLVPIPHHHLPLRNQVGDIVRIRTALCMLQLLLLLLLVVCY